MTIKSRCRRILRPSLLAGTLAAISAAGCAEASETAPAQPSEPTEAVAGVQTPPPASAPEQPGTRADEDRTAPPPADPLVEAVPTYATILSAVVTDAGLVRYDLLGEPGRAALLDRVVLAFARAALPGTREERLALWCNAYNANVLAEALRESRKPGFENVVKVPGFFDQRQVTVAGERLTLNDLENERVRPLGDARIHAALVCAAMSCPPLRNEPYDPVRLDEQFDDQCTRWVNDDSKFRMVEGRLGTSEILKWYAEDFKRPPYGNAVGFVLAFARPGSPISRYIVNSDEPRIEWLKYDWTLNQAAPPPARRSDS